MRFGTADHSNGVFAVPSKYTGGSDDVGGLYFMHWADVLFFEKGTMVGSRTTVTENPSLVVITEQQSTAVPEPGSCTLWGLGVGVLGFVGWRRRRKQTLSSH